MMQPRWKRTLLVMLAPPPSDLELPVIQADADSVRKLSTLVLTFKAMQKAQVRYFGTHSDNY